MTCPFCGAKEIFRENFDCGTNRGVTADGEIRSVGCYEREIEKLREKKAKGLEWEYVTCECYEAHGFNGAWRILYDSQSRCFDVLLDGDFVKETTTRIPTEAKAHAEELHQQAWRELRERWDAV